MNTTSPAIRCQNRILVSVIGQFERRGFRRATVQMDTHKGTCTLNFADRSPAIKQVRDIFKRRTVRRFKGFLTIS